MLYYFSAILSDVMLAIIFRSNFSSPCFKNCLGEVGSGKTTLVAKLQGVEEYMKGRGLEYLYFSVHDDDIDGIQSDFFFCFLSINKPLECPNV